MTDKSSRDIRLGDLSAVDAALDRDPVLGAADTEASLEPARQARSPRGRSVAPPVAQAASPARPVSWAVVALAIVVFVLVAVVVVLLREQRELSEAIRVLDAKARESVETLESRVASTSSTLKSADSETQRSLNILGNDIASLNRSQRKLGEALELEVKARAAVDAELKALAVEFRKADQAAAQADAQRDTRIKALGENIDQVNARLKTVADGLARLERSGDVTQLRSEVAVLGASIRQLEDDHEKRLKAIEQSTGSNDAFRRQVNATIDRLNQQVTELYQRR